MKTKPLLKNIARDLLALGGIPFYVLVIIRAYIGHDIYFVYEIVIAGIILLLLSRFFKAAYSVACSLTVLIFISLYYDEPFFTIGASIVWVLLLFSANYLGKSWEEIGKGVGFGIVATGISYGICYLI